MRSPQEIKDDLNIVLVASAPEDYQVQAGLRLAGDVVDWMLDVAESLRNIS